MFFLNSFQFQKKPVPSHANPGINLKPMVSTLCQNSCIIMPHERNGYGLMRIGLTVRHYLHFFLLM